MGDNRTNMEAKNQFKLFLPGLLAEKNNGITVLAADLKEAETVIALYKTSHQNLELLTEAVYETENYKSFTEIAQEFLQQHQPGPIDRVSIAVPGPVIAGKSEPLRLQWRLDAAEFSRVTGLENVCLINDLEASAYGIKHVDDEDFVKIHDVVNFTQGNAALLAPGEGLGEAALFWDGHCLRPFATEGGHCEFSPRTNQEVEFYTYLQKIYGIVSWESVLSVSGLFNIYRFLRDVKQHQQPQWLSAEIESGNFTDAVIRGALECTDRICTATVETFLTYMAREANSLVLKMKATGGLYLTGKLPIMLEQFIDKGQFYKNFVISDKMENILEDIPIYLVRDEKTILKGAALYGAFSQE